MLAGGLDSTGDRSRLWSLIRERIQQRLGHQRYGIWFKETELAALDGSALVVGVPSVITQQYLSHKYKDTVSKAAEELLGRPVEVRFAVEPALFRQMRAERRDECAQGSEPSGHEPLADRKPAPRARQPVNRRSFEQLVVTEANRFPFAAAQEIARAARPRFCFLVVIGKTGSGKTALLEALHGAALDSGAASRAEYVMAEAWCNDLYHAIQSGKTWSFRQRYRSCDMLIMDGLGFFQGKPAAQDELMYTAKNLLSNGGRVVLSSSVHPKDFRDVTAEFRSLLSGAFWVELVVPPAAECEQVARRLGQGYGLRAAGEVFRYLAERHSCDLHELNGAVCSLAAYAAAHGHGMMDLVLARQALAATSRSRRRVPTLEDIRKVLVEALPVTDNELSGKVRSRSASRARQIGMYLARQLTRESLSDIGRHFGGRTHSTVKHGIEKVTEEMQADEETAQVVKRCLEKLEER